MRAPQTGDRPPTAARDVGHALPVYLEVSSVAALLDNPGAGLPPPHLRGRPQSEPGLADATHPVSVSSRLLHSMRWLSPNCCRRPTKLVSSAGNALRVSDFTIVMPIVSAWTTSGRPAPCRACVPATPLSMELNEAPELSQGDCPCPPTGRRPPVMRPSNSGLSAMTERAALQQLSHCSTRRLLRSCLVSGVPADRLRSRAPHRPLGTHLATCANARGPLPAGKGL